MNGSICNFDLISIFFAMIAVGSLPTTHDSEGESWFRVWRSKSHAINNCQWCLPHIQGVPLWVELQFNLVQLEYNGTTIVFSSEISDLDAFAIWIQLHQLTQKSNDCYIRICNVKESFDLWSFKSIALIRMIILWYVINN